MQVGNLNICLCTDCQDSDSVISVLHGVKNTSFKLSISNFEDVVSEDHDIIIYYIDKFSSAFLENLDKTQSISHIRSIIIVEGNNIQLVSSLAKMGINEIFVFPYEIYKFHSYIEELLQSLHVKTGDEDGNNCLNKALASFVGQFHGMKSLISLAKKAAENPSLNVLLLGDTGTGKSLLAKLIHSLGEKKSSPFIEVICTAIPENLLESELFGYEKGAFTDAKNRKMGLFELAEGGTIFLDEIGDLSLSLQAKLLHVTENKVIRRLGGLKDIPINTRIITATNRDLQKQIDNKLFRSDLFYRLNMITLTLPPLTERDNDLIILTEHFVKEFSQLYGKKIHCISNKAWEIIRNYNWPGNIRELRHVIERAVLLSDNATLDEKYFPGITKEESAGTAEMHLTKTENNGSIILELDYQSMTLTEVNKAYAKKVLDRLQGNKTKTSKLLGISRPTLDNLLN